MGHEIVKNHCVYGAYHSYLGCKTTFGLNLSKIVIDNEPKQTPVTNPALISDCKEFMPLLSLPNKSVKCVIIDSISKGY